MNSLEILKTGPLSLIQDLGRTGHLRSGVGVSGAADRRSLQLGNRLVGNAEDAAGIEILMGGLRLRAHQLMTLAFTGARAQAYRDGVPVGHSSVIVVNPGQVVRLDYAPSGLRTYLTVRGGIAVPEILGSRSTDTLSGIGPAPLKPNDVLPIGPIPAVFPLVDVAPVHQVSGGTLGIRVVFGPRADQFVNPEALTAGRWAVSTDSDRIGARLDRVGTDALLQRADGLELPTEGLALGSIQVPPSGQPVAFLADHPITGGYPVVAVVTDADIDRLGQARPGQKIRFVGN
ncbi:biotin-dependent carboxyltransferase family protein [Rhodococcus sp. IEGM 1379]|uniref:5-oxoprolinase subunit C family protein n=1 Tax=Rhodococcus sp. IEGM 1379 TaxID=3047086 RepID=UPI0024B85AD1|nr:biotin-dependent carboxyltransferase family protein [Rhodococcus sp. IEGM 1379]MDI9914099.1 biotin-dependent carboxyltransferase family protein [Rhodococcus sp. IEGM 1379]